MLWLVSCVMLLMNLYVQWSIRRVCLHVCACVSLEIWWKKCERENSLGRCVNPSSESEVDGATFQSRVLFCFALFCKYKCRNFSTVVGRWDLCVNLCNSGVFQDLLPNQVFLFLLRSKHIFLNSQWKKWKSKKVFHQTLGNILHLVFLCM